MLRVFAQVAPHLSCKAWQCTIQNAPILNYAELVLVFHFDSALASLTFNDGAFPSSRKVKHEKPVGSGSLLSLLWHFYPANTQGGGGLLHRSSSLYFLLENIAAFSCLLELISLEGINCLLIS